MTRRLEKKAVVVTGGGTGIGLGNGIELVVGGGMTLT
jgi:NAD(P)-dependent dehydrogenase (short-subunit alcohol dehydrogenase family)